MTKDTPLGVQSFDCRTDESGGAFPAIEITARIVIAQMGGIDNIFTKGIKERLVEAVRDNVELKKPEVCGEGSAK